MANDLFGNLGNLGGIVKGLSSFMPQDDPAVKMMNAQTQVSDLKKQEADIYVEIGKKAVAQYGLDAFPEYADKLRLIQSNLQAATSELNSQKAEHEAREKAAADAAAAARCPSCGYDNPEGTRFCQECGTKMGAQNCVSCGAALQPGTRFCGECGAKQPE